MSNLSLASVRSQGLVRVAGCRYQPFSTRPLQIDPATGKLKDPPRNRFDDIGAVLGFPQHRWFQTIYAATQLEGAFGELLALRRLGSRGAAAITEIANRVPETVNRAALRSDPGFPGHGVIQADWWQSRIATSATIDRMARFIDLGHPSTLSYLLANFLPYIRAHVPSLAVDEDFDLSDVMSRNRTLTQHLAWYLHDLPRESFSELKTGEEIAGIRYLSRHSPEWECWALFADRIEGRLDIGDSREIAADDPDLLAVAKHFGLSVETDTPGQYLRPWLDS